MNNPAVRPIKGDLKNTVNEFPLINNDKIPVKVKKNISVPTKTLKHLPHYRFYLQQLKKKSREFVSNERLAADLKLSIADVRKDLENLHESLSASEIHSVDTLIKIVESYLGYDQKNAAVIAGAGNLGKALLNYPGFQTCGLEILAIFDNNPDLVGRKIGEKEIFNVDRLGELADRLKANIGIITTPPEPAQRIADVMIENGIKGIWNFSLAIIKVPENIMLRNTSLYSEYLRLMQTMLSSSSDDVLK
jgi:redox-sensing transcriptional repressor